MKELLAVSKSEGELPVPSEWRQTFIRIVEEFRSGNFRIGQNIPGVRPLSHRDAERIKFNISSYDSELSELSEETWETSVCRWMNGYWDVLVDLSTVQGGLSDLVLFSRVYELDGSYEFVVTSVHVP